MTLKMPTALSAESTAFWYQYTITGITNEEFTYTSPLTQSTTGADGLATITLDADTLGLLQGAYRFEITVQDAEISPAITRHGVEAMRLINGLPASGMVDLSNINEELFQFDLTISDKVGNILTPSLKDGQEIYEIGWEEDIATLAVTLEEPVAANETIEWYVNGVLDETVNTDNAVNGQYTFTFQKPASGEYLSSFVVTAIIRDNNTLMSIGSLTPFTVGITNPELEFAEQIFTFSLNDGGESYTVTGLAAPNGEFVMPENNVLKIPATYQGKPVTKIRYDAFKDRTDIVGTVVIPDSVTYIGSSAFKNCSAIANVNIPEGVTTLYHETFTNCTNIKSITLPSTLKEIMDPSSYGNPGVFENCSSLSSIIIPDSVTLIGCDAFDGCSSLESINIPDGVTKIRARTFSRCSSLAEINIPESVTSIGNSAFSGCSALESISIPDSVTSIESYAFKNCSVLKTIVIPENVTSIGSEAFYNCSSLTSINIPEGVTTISSGTFSGCTNLTEVTLPSTLETIEDAIIDYGAFGSCTSLESIVIPDGVTSIGKNAFENCSSLKTVTFSDSSQLTSIGSGAFVSCFRLTSINIPNGVTKIGIQAFSGCSQLETVEFSDSSQLTSIDEFAFWYCMSLQSIIIPEGVTEIRQNTFYDCINLDGIYCEVTAQPEGWSDSWLGNCNADVFWGASRAEYDAIMNNDNVPYEVPQPVISVDDGNATITCDKAFAHIYYTINGEAPTADNSTLYTEPFAVSEGDTIKAVAYVGNGIYSDVATVIYEEATGETNKLPTPVLKMVDGFLTFDNYEDYTQYQDHGIIFIASNELNFVQDFDTTSYGGEGFELQAYIDGLVDFSEFGYTEGSEFHIKAFCLSGDYEDSEIGSYIP